MKELDQDQRDELDRLQRALAEGERKLGAALEEYNAAVVSAYEALRERIDEFEAVQAEVDDFHSDVGQSLFLHLVDKGPEWRETEEGLALWAWQSAWQDATTYPPSFDPPAPLKLPDPLPSALLAAAPRSVDDVAAPLDEAEGHLSTPERGGSSAKLRSTTIREDWSCIVAFASERFPEGEFRLAGGATEEQIGAAEQILGFRLPDDVRESYRIHNGSDDSSFPIIGVLSPIDVVADDFAQRRGWPEDGWGTPDEIEGPIKPVWWNTARVQLTDDSSGSGLTIDLDPAEGGTWGQVIHHDHEVGPRRVYAPSWGALLRRIADDAEAGKIVHDEGYTWGHSQDWVFDPPISASASSQAEEPGIAAGATARRYFEFTSGTSNKFWEVSSEGVEMMTRYGKVGTKGQTTTKSFDTTEKAAAEAAKVIAKKVKDGYVEKEQ
jgi:cell wall assembly regulator SMI1/predicted DNA-binding WGR domain protein